MVTVVTFVIVAVNNTTQLRVAGLLRWTGETVYVVIFEMKAVEVNDVG